VVDLARRSWQEASRTLSYMAAFGAAIGLARLAPRRWRSVAAVLIVSAIVSLYGSRRRYSRFAEPQRDVCAPARTVLLLERGRPGWRRSARRGAVARRATQRHPALKRARRTAVVHADCLRAALLPRGSLLALGAGVALWFALVPLRLRASSCSRWAPRAPRA